MNLSDEVRLQLIDAAIQARQWAYAPYSEYKVGAAVLTSSGKIYDGVNIENAAYPDGICAERVAIFKAISEGERLFTAVVVATKDGGGAPCGSCRQVMAEFGLDTQIIMVDEGGQLCDEISLKNLLPKAFTPRSLKR